MRRWTFLSVTAMVAPSEVDWTVTVTEPLPDCPSVAAAWERIAMQTTWGMWRSESKMRGPDVTTVLAPRRPSPCGRETRTS
jgi:hypothetical protein